MQELLENDIKFLQGVGPRRAEILNKEFNIFLFGISCIIFHTGILTGRGFILPGNQ